MYEYRLKFHWSLFLRVLLTISQHWFRLVGAKPLSGPMMVRLPTHICVTRPQWVNPLWPVAALYCLEFLVNIDPGNGVLRNRCQDATWTNHFDLSPFWTFNYEYFPDNIRIECHVFKGKQSWLRSEWIKPLPSRFIWRHDSDFETKTMKRMTSEYRATQSHPLPHHSTSQYKDRLIYVWRFPC